MRDLFDVLGLAGSAHPLEVRRVSARYVPRSHPDFDAGGSSAAPSVRPARDAAVDYIDPAGLIDRIQAAFFANAG